MTQATIKRITYIAGDLIASLCGLFVFYLFRYHMTLGGSDISFAEWSHYPLIECGYAVFPTLYVVVTAISGFYNSPIYKSRYDLLSSTISNSIVTSLLVYFIIVINDNVVERLVHYSLLLVLVASFTVLVLAMRMIINASIKRRIKDGRLRYNIIIVGSGKEAADFAHRLEQSNASMGYHVVAIVDEQPAMQEISGYKVISPNDIDNIIESRQVDAFVIADKGFDKARTLEAVKNLFRYERSIFLPLSSYDMITSRPRLSTVVGETLIDVMSTGITPCSQNLKRISDIIISALGLIVLSPVYAVLAIAVKRSSPGSIIYSQQRVGRQGRKFNIYKFRSMVADAEPNGPSLSSETDSRITPLGHVMRKYRLDELPQLWNVLRGDMSLVGPRPEREYYLRQLIERNESAYTLLKIRPGLTSLGNVKFGYARSIDEMCQRLQYDLLYVDNMSLMLDIKVMFYTVQTVITGKGI